MKIPIGTLCIIIRAKYEWALGLQCEVTGYDPIGIGIYEIFVPAGKAKECLISRQGLCPIDPDTRILDIESESVTDMLIQCVSDHKAKHDLPN